MSRFVVLRADFSGDQMIVLIRDADTGIEHYRSVDDVLRTKVVDELEAGDVEYVKQLRIEQNGSGHGEE
jgi:hypothetical protein